MDVFNQDNVQLLIRAIRKCDSAAECQQFLEDLLTTRELLDISQRLAVAKLLYQGSTCSEISAACGASSATISRVNRCYRYGAGGYRAVLDKLDEGGRGNG